ncbi:MAG: hypothetical protein O0X93_01855 [Methanocorpusculum sp.]|nr:hypothetical protein [Methanocorpusculum sp.]MDE2521890.1 hypothetical protein [Methanocorpusculum sp.]MDE2524678.1 hypothetical protein [Methanocorpusculum sp.]
MTVFFVYLLILCGCILGILALYPYLYYTTGIYRLPETPTTTPYPLTYPPISIVMNAYKEGELARTRVHDILNAEYPKEKMSVYLVNDGNDEETGRVIQDILKSNPQVYLSIFLQRFVWEKPSAKIRFSPKSETNS